MLDWTRYVEERLDLSDLEADRQANIVEDVAAELQERYDAALAAFITEGTLSPSAAASLNAVLMSTERLMTREAGLPRRSWFRHQIYAPGFYTGYGVKTLPGVREAIEERAWDEAAEQMGHVAATLNNVSDAIDRATAMLAK